MKNKFNKCCCPETPVGFNCGICSFNCFIESEYFPNRVVSIVKARHPNGNEGHFGRITGSFLLEQTNDYVVLYYDFKGDGDLNEETACSFVKISGNGFQFRVDFGHGYVDAEEFIDSTKFGTEFGWRGNLVAFCLHFDEGEVVLTLQVGNSVNVFTGSFTYGNHPGGSVGYKEVFEASVSLDTFSRAFSESDLENEIICPACSGVTCDPCCPEPAAAGWLVTFQGLSTATTSPFGDGYSDCALANQTHVLDPFGSGCEWSYGAPLLAGMIDMCVQRRANYFIILQIFNAGGGRCSLRLELGLFAPEDPGNPSDCGPLSIGVWRSTGNIQEVCSGTHVLTKTSENQLPWLYCDGVQDTVTVIAI